MASLAAAAAVQLHTRAGARRQARPLTAAHRSPMAANRTYQTAKQAAAVKPVAVKPALAELPTKTAARAPAARARAARALAARARAARRAWAEPSPPLAQAAGRQTLPAVPRPHPRTRPRAPPPRTIKPRACTPASAAPVARSSAGGPVRATAAVAAAPLLRESGTAPRP